MQEKIKEILSDSSSRKKVFLILILVGAIIVLLSSSFTSTEDKKSNNDSQTINYEEYTDALENQLKSTVSSIDGVGECEVMITLQNSNQSVYAKNSESKNDDSSSSDNQDYVIVDKGNNEEPVLINQYFAGVRGVAVVCSGGDNPAVREKVIETVSALFNISSNRISVSKLKSNG